MLDKIYESLLNDDYIAEQAKGRIKYYEYPETATMDKPHIIIDPLDVPMPDDYADDTWLTDDYLYQIEVWSKSRSITEKLSARIRHVLWGMGFKQGSGMDEWDKDFNIFRDARRYRGKVYRDDFDSL